MPNRMGYPISRFTQPITTQKKGLRLSIIGWQADLKIWTTNFNIKHVIPCYARKDKSNMFEKISFYTLLYMYIAHGYLFDRIKKTYNLMVAPVDAACGERGGGVTR